MMDRQRSVDRSIDVSRRAELPVNRLTQMDWIGESGAIIHQKAPCLNPSIDRSRQAPLVQARPSARIPRHHHHLYIIIGSPTHPHSSSRSSSCCMRKPTQAAPSSKSQSNYAASRCLCIPASSAPHRHVFLPLHCGWVQLFFPSIHPTSMHTHTQRSHSNHGPG